MILYLATTTPLALRMNCCENKEIKCIIHPLKRIARHPIPIGEYKCKYIRDLIHLTGLLSDTFPFELINVSLNLPIFLPLINGSSRSILSLRLFD